MGIVQSRAGEGDGGVREVFIGGIKGGTPLQSCQPSLGMGSLGGPHARSGSVRGAPRQPMPDAAELERRFTKVLVSRELQYLSACKSFPLIFFTASPLDLHVYEHPLRISEGFRFELSVPMTCLL